MKLKLRAPALAPHRQIWVLYVVAVLAVAVVAAGMLLALAPARDQFVKLDTELIPARHQLDLASQNYAEAARTLGRAAVETDPGQREAAFQLLAKSNSDGGAAWTAFERLSLHLPGEDALAKTFKEALHQGSAVGLQFLTGPLTSVPEFANVTELSNVMLADLDEIRSLYQAQVQRAVHQANQDLGDTERNILILAGAALAATSVAFGVAARGARGRERKAALLGQTMADASTRNDLEARLQRSLEMVKSEDASYRLLTRALSISAPGLATELLLADSSQAHFRRVTTTPELDAGGCAVMSPRDCPAANRGQTQVWRSSSDLDSCPYLQDRAGGACSALCVPVSIAGNTVGVMHSVAADEQPPPSTTIVKVELIARKAGERIGMLRAFSKSEVQAHTDPLTGLMNRRSLEIEVRALAMEERPYTIAYCDLDHFKQLNDVYGHDAGDRALRLFARVVRDSLRPLDIPARYGGEEFLIVLPECSVADAVVVIDRLREKLAAAQSGGTVPPFTASFGVASAQFDVPFDDTVELADGALLQAKAQGRDRVVIAGPDNDERTVATIALDEPPRSLVA